MASERFEGVERRRFPALLGVGVAMALVVIAVAFALEADLAWPLLLLLVVCIGAAVAFRLIAGSSRDDADSSDGFVRQPATRSRPLGDTPEAHDEISPLDVPRDSPEHDATARAAGGPGGTTHGHRR